MLVFGDWDDLKCWYPLFLFCFRRGDWYTFTCCSVCPFGLWLLTEETDWYYNYIFVCVWVCNHSNVIIICFFSPQVNQWLNTWVHLSNYFWVGNKKNKYQNKLLFIGTRKGTVSTPFVSVLFCVRYSSYTQRTAPSDESIFFSLCCCSLNR